MAEITLTKENFEQVVLKADKPVLVDFWATWCGPCQRMGPVLEQLAQDYEGKIIVGKVNVDEQEELAQQFEIMSIPAIKVFKNGKITASNVGFTPSDILEKMIE